MRENRKHITLVSSDEARRLKDKTDDARLDAMTDADVAKAVAEDPDAPPLDLDWTQARLSVPPGKHVVTLRLDHDVLEWFRAQGKGYQTRINQVLRAFYEARRNQLAADIVEGVKASGRGYDPRVEQALREVLKRGTFREREKREFSSETAEAAKPDVPPKKSITSDYIICLEDGRKFKSLKRHLRTQYNLSPEEYREKWGLSSDYPMVAPAYAKTRSALAKQMGRAVSKRRA
jgi:predicted transcriptional regulator